MNPLGQRPEAVRSPAADFQVDTNITRGQDSQGLEVFAVEVDGSQLEGTRSHRNLHSGKIVTFYVATSREELMKFLSTESVPVSNATITAVSESELDAYTRSEVAAVKDDIDEDEPVILAHTKRVIEKAAA